MTKEEQFFAAVASRGLVRPSVSAIICGKKGFLVQRPTDDPYACFAFIGGEYELGDTFDERIRKEVETSRASAS